MRRTVHFILPTILTALAAALIASGCSNTVTPTDPAPAGFILKENGIERVKQVNGAVTGKIEIIRKAGTGVAATPSGDLEITFTNPDGSNWVTEANDSIEISLNSSLILDVQRDPANKWAFKLLAKGGGDAGVNFTYFRGSKPLFSTHTIPVSVVSEGLDLEKMRIITNGGSFINVTDTVLGQITSGWGTEPIPMNIDFFTAQNELVDVWSTAYPNASITWDVGDTSIVDFVQGPDDRSEFHMLAKTPGNTTVTFTLTDSSSTLGRYTAFVSPPIDVKLH